MYKSQIKIILINLSDIKGTVHFESMQKGQIFNQAYCMEILKRLREDVLRKRPERWPNDWILRHDNVPAHKALSVKLFLFKKLITQIKHPSPDWLRMTS
jgi:hypothetical protein